MLAGNHHAHFDLRAMESSCQQAGEGGAWCLAMVHWSGTARYIGKDNMRLAVCIVGLPGSGRKCGSAICSGEAIAASDVARRDGSEGTVRTLHY